MYGSTCFGRLFSQDQERTTALEAFDFTVEAWRLELKPPLSNGKTRGSECSCMLLMIKGEAPEPCWAAHKRQVINLRNCCIWLVNLLESYDDARTCERQMYLQHLVFVRPLLLPAAIAAGSSNGLTNTRCCRYIWRSQVRASSYDSNKLTNEVQQFYKFITWPLCVAQQVSDVFLHIIRNIQLH